MRWKHMAFGLVALAPHTDLLAQDSVSEAARQDHYSVGTSLGPSFKGNDLNSIYTAILKASELAEKTEFETTTEHDARVSNLAGLLAPLDPTKPVIIPVGGARARYDADQQAWLVQTSFGYGCDELVASRAWKCPTDPLSFDGRSYVGENAFGVRRNVEVKSRVDLNFVIDRSWIENSGFYRHDIGGYFLNAIIPMAAPDAKIIGANGIRVFIVGIVFGAMIERGRSDYKSPTLSDPTKGYNSEITLPILAKKIIFVARETGEIVTTISPFPSQ